MKKRIALPMAVLLSATLVLAGCQNGGNPQSQTSGTAQATGVAPAPSTETGGVRKISIGTASPGGGFHMGASALATVVNTKMSGYELAVEVTGASAQNAALVQSGDIELGLCATEVAWEAYNGKYSFEGNTCDKIRTIIPGWGGVYMFITTAETGIKKLEDFAGKSFSGGAVGSSTAIFVERAFSLFNVKPNLMNLPNTESARTLGDGTIHGFGLAHPAASVTELETTKNIVLVTIPPEYKSKFQEAYPQYVWLDIPAGYYKALPDGAHSAGLYNLVLASADVDEQVVYDIVKGAYENRELIKTVFPQFAEEMDIKNLGCSTIPYHAGAIRYFQEQGGTIPDALIPPEAK